jgi:hypothetical protein
VTNSLECQIIESRIRTVVVFPTKLALSMHSRGDTAFFILFFQKPTLYSWAKSLSEHRAPAKYQHQNTNLSQNSLTSGKKKNFYVYDYSNQKIRSRTLATNEEQADFFG